MCAKDQVSHVLLFVHLLILHIQAATGVDMLVSYDATDHPHTLQALLSKNMVEGIYLPLNTSLL